MDPSSSWPVHRGGAWVGACLIAGSLLVGCAAPPPPPVPVPLAPRSYVALMANEDGSTGRVLFRSASGDIQLERAHQAVALQGPTVAYDVSPAQLERDVSAAIGAQPRLPKIFLLYFEVGDARINKASESLLQAVLDEVQSRSVPDLSITGHTDTVGNAALNETLSLRRAEQVAKLLKSSTTGGLQIEVTSHGERNLLVPTPDATAEPRNRRVEITVR